MRNKFLHIKEKCKVCGGKGYIWDPRRSFLPGDDGKEADPTQCDCLKNMMLYNTLDQANVPSEYYDLTIEDFDDSKSVEKKEIKKFVSGIIADPKDFYNRGGNVFLYGPNGTGKTMLSIEILKAALHTKHSIHYEFYPIICETFSKKGYKADEVKEKYDNIFSNVDFLVIDEIGKETEYSDQDTSRRLLEIHILKKRGGKPTIFLANMYNTKVKPPTPYSEDQVRAEIRGRYGPSVASMMGKTWKFYNVWDVDAREADNV